MELVYRNARLFSCTLEYSEECLSALVDDVRATVHSRRPTYLGVLGGLAACKVDDGTIIVHNEYDRTIQEVLWSNQDIWLTMAASQSNGMFYL